MKDGKRVMECLKKGGRIANQCIDKIVQAQLLVDLLNIYVLFKDKGNSEVSVIGCYGNSDGHVIG